MSFFAIKDEEEIARKYDLPVVCSQNRRGFLVVFSSWLVDISFKNSDAIDTLFEFYNILNEKQALILANCLNCLSTEKNFIRSYIYAEKLKKSTLQKRITGTIIYNEEKNFPHELIFIEKYLRKHEAEINIKEIFTNVFKAALSRSRQIKRDKIKSEKISAFVKRINNLLCVCGVFDLDFGKVTGMVDVIIANLNKSFTREDCPRKRLGYGCMQNNGNHCYGIPCEQASGCPRRNYLKEHCYGDNCTGLPCKNEKFLRYKDEKDIKISLVILLD